MEKPAKSISIQDLGRVFSGEVTDRAEVGYPAGPINVYGPVANSDTRDACSSLVLRLKGLKLVDSAKQTSDYAEQLDLVVADPLGIGVVALSYQRNAKALNVESLCGLITPPIEVLDQDPGLPSVSALVFVYIRPAQAAACGSFA